MNRPTPVETTAVSLDGRQFRFTGSADAPLDPGHLVKLLDPDGDAQLGQIEHVSFGTGDRLTGEGRILGTIAGDGRELLAKLSHGFTAAGIEDADAATIELLYRSADIALPIGSHLDSPGMHARLLAKQFNRHTFWCGQSGSGKTYALGVVLEQLLLHTGMPMVIFDPNADFVRMRDPAPDAPRGAEADALAGRDIRVLRPSAGDDDALVVRFTDLPLRARGAILRLDPLTDRQEYNELVHLEHTVGVLDAQRIVSELVARATPAAAALAARVENIRILDWDVWAGRRTPVTEIIDERPDATVLDLGGFEFTDESLVVALAVLDDLWAKRESRRPLLLVIDEAHNLAAPDADTPLRAAVRDRLIQIAAEGRKFGLWMLLSTQRPSRVHPSILSQCDNLALMKMTSPADLSELAELFGFVPPALLARAQRFRQGEALFAGGFVPTPTLVQMGARRTREGGLDVRVPLRDAPTVIPDRQR
jgi:DNA helicase HerA-like ATPase